MWSCPAHLDWNVGDRSLCNLLKSATQHFPHRQNCDLEKPIISTSLCCGLDDIQRNSKVVARDQHSVFLSNVEAMVKQFQMNTACLNAGAVLTFRMSLWWILVYQRTYLNVPWLQVHKCSVHLTLFWHQPGWRPGCHGLGWRFCITTWR